MSEMYSNPSLAEVCQKLREYEKANQRTLRPWMHITVGPGASDELSEEDLKKFISEFMDEIGYGDQPYIVFLHYDIDRKHYHIVSVNVDREGNKVSTMREDDFGERKPYKLEKRLFNEVLRKLQKKYKYEIGTGEELAQAPERFDPKAGNIKQQIDAIIKEEMKNPYIDGIGPLCKSVYFRGVDLSYVTSRKNLELPPTPKERAANVFIAKGLNSDDTASKAHPRIYDSRESKALYGGLYKTNRDRLECLLYVTRALEEANSMKKFTDSLVVKRSEKDGKAIVEFHNREYEADDILPGLNQFLKTNSEKDFTVRKKQLVNRQKNLENYRRMGEMLPEDYLAVKLQDVVDVMNHSEISRDPNSGLTPPVTGLWIAVEKNPDQVVEDKWTGPGRVCVALVDSKERWLKFNSNQNGDIILRSDADSEKTL